MHGVVKRIVMDKGFGFVRAEDGTEYFFHRSEITGATRFESLEENVTRVTFEPGQGPKGPRCVDLRTL